MATFWAILGNTLATFIPISGHTGPDASQTKDRGFKSYIGTVLFFSNSYSVLNEKVEEEAVYLVPIF